MRPWRRVTPTSGPTSRSPGSGTGRFMTGEPARVVTAGETMALVVPTAPGRLRHAANLTLSIGGAESNVAVGLARLGVPASWVSALGEGGLGGLRPPRLR